MFRFIKAIRHVFCRKKVWSMYCYWIGVEDFPKKQSYRKCKECGHTWNHRSMTDYK